MFLTINLKKLLSILLVTVFAFFGFFFLIKHTNVSSREYRQLTIVLDAGHGGRDGGAEGLITKVKESDINLKIVKHLENYLKKVGFKVVLTRTNENGLYGEFDRDYKLRDMQERKKIIQEAKANVVVSIHLNSFPSRELKGAQAFYDDQNPNGKILAHTIQSELARHLPNAKNEPNFGDYYILKCTHNPSVMVECGFLTNKEEELLLQNEEYQQKVAYAIFSGLLRYFQTGENYNFSND